MKGELGLAVVVAASLLVFVPMDHWFPRLVAVAILTLAALLLGMSLESTTTERSNTDERRAADPR